MKQKEDIKQSVLALAQGAFDKKGKDIEILDLEGISMLGDYFMIVSANNIKQSQSIADEIEDVAAEQGMTVLHREGYREGDWILLDFGDIICHIFGGDDTREFYGLEALWSDASRVPFEGE
ncbi:ribosome silencing factor [Veillonella caviae]|uniref:ribosome silencing factor n=1 Tax=Veillonella caviae TaxID=248316 RepID=UPI000F8F7C91|nr:ribosome silencing factor [Veillonella caviae]MCF0158269.1 ribosome silencing factor [Veillonella sp.]MCI5708504.1 ribosome silencing factor [Veillonella caviae]MCI6406615.1 ribosome silencing factor [Veillonella caviae]MCI7693905.1 ribosome silencing factor [Veillonella caviae]MDD7290664.1 ribosome silencing factor [Veillonella caviae]